MTDYSGTISQGCLRRNEIQSRPCQGIVESTSLNLPTNPHDVHNTIKIGSSGNCGGWIVGISDFRNCGCIAIKEPSSSRKPCNRNPTTLQKSRILQEVSTYGHIGGYRIRKVCRRRPCNSDTCEPIVGFDYIIDDVESFRSGLCVVRKELSLGSSRSGTP